MLFYIVFQLFSLSMCSNHFQFKRLKRNTMFVNVLFVRKFPDNIFFTSFALPILIFFVLIICLDLKMVKIVGKIWPLCLIKLELVKEEWDGASLLGFFFLFNLNYLLMAHILRIIKLPLVFCVI